MQWLRLYHDTINDPKWRVVASESGQPLSAVLAVWMSMLINASDADERGSLQGWNDRFAGAALDLRGDAVRKIREAMQGIVLDGVRLTGWDKRQRASDNIAKRVARHRAKEPDSAPPGGGSTVGNGKSGNVTNGKGNGHVTLQKRNCTDFSLDLSYLPSNPTTLIKTGGGDAGAGAREAAQRVAELTGLAASARNVATVERWLGLGYDPDRDIVPAVAAAVSSAKDEIGCFEYFSKAIKRHHVKRIAPPAPEPAASNVTPFPRQSGGRPLEPGAAEFLALYERKKAEMS